MEHIFIPRIENPTISAQPINFTKHQFRWDIPNVMVNSDGTLCMDIMLYGKMKRYPVALDIQNLYVKCYTYTGTGRGGDSLVEFIHDNRSFITRINNIKGKYLINKLRSIGISVYSDLREAKRAEILNSITINTINSNPIDMISDPNEWDYLVSKSEV